MIYIVGILCIGAGTLIILKTEWILRNAGRVAWAEEHLGVEGGTRLFYKLVGIGFILFGFIYMSGFFGDIVQFIFRVRGM